MYKVEEANPLPRVGTYERHTTLNADMTVFLYNIETVSKA